MQTFLYLHMHIPTFMFTNKDYFFVRIGVYGSINIYLSNLYENIKDKMTGRDDRTENT